MLLSMKFPRFIFLGLLLAAGCPFLPERDESAEPAGVPESFSREGTDRPLPESWWEDFGSGELDRLVGEALAGNFTIRQAEARLRQAEASARGAGAGRYPQVDLVGEGGASRSRTETDGVGTIATSEDYALFLAAGYEIDLWGRVRSTYRQADLLTAAAGEDLAAARITLAGEVADRWLREVELRSRLELARRQVETNRTYRELLLLRRRRGLATALAVFQQEQIVAATESLIPVLESELETVRHELAVLTGRPPRTDLGLSADTLPVRPPLPELGLPSGMIGNRPDIRAAFSRLEAADWGVSAARANRLPSLTLTGSAGYRSGEFANLFNNWFAAFAGGLLAPLIDGGSRSAEVDRTRAAAEEQLASYRATVLQALREVENALVREEKQAGYLASLRRQLTAAENALAQARLRFRKGEIEYLDVLSSLSSSQALQRELLIAERDILRYRVALYRALAGGWGEEDGNQ